MSTHVIVGAFLTSILSGLIPLVNGEVVVMGAALLVAPRELAPLVLACACGQMLAKVLLYGCARWSPSRLPERAGPALARAKALGRLKGGAALAVLASSSTGLPPFYLVTLAAGVLGVRLALFASLGFAGTVIRYAILAWGATRLVSGAGLP